METMGNTYRTFYMPYCFSQNGVILPIDEDTGIPVHPNCHCEIITKISVTTGTATIDGENGADYYLKYSGQLPDYYITLSDDKKTWLESFSRQFR
ncbi:MAG: hypothetical protein U0N36_04620 [Eubacterium sp.]